MNSSDENCPSEKEPFAPTGTLVLLGFILAGMIVAWLFLYFGVFLPRGIVH